jgi:hypothetical protein
MMTTKLQYADFRVDHLDFDSLDVMAEIDRKITLRHLKEKKTSRTYIDGLYYYLTEDEIQNHVKTLQKMLATSMIEKTNDEGKKYFGFSGSHIKAIYDYLVEAKICPSKEIKR